MTQKEIKKECDVSCKKIKDARVRLSELRSICKHESTFEGVYSWRVGSTAMATICRDCGDAIMIN